jgi:hypothetical protein
MTSVGVYNTAEPTGDQRARTLPPPLRLPPLLPNEEWEGEDERGGSYDEYDGGAYDE